MAESFVLRMTSSPDDRNAREILELILAAASLMLEIDILIEEEAVDFLTEAHARQWRQLHDHDLARIWCHGSRPQKDRQVLDPRFVDDRGRAGLLDSRTVIDL